MSLHRSCCPCGDCYVGTLCTPCLEPCDDVAQPAETVYISAREWGLHADDVPGTGSGWVIYVGGAWYFFDGTTATCETRASDIDWLISFRADECPDFSVGVDIVVPFVGGFDFSTSWNVYVDIGDIDDPTACVQNAWNNETPGSAPTVISADQPTYHDWDMDVVCVASDPIDMIYGTGSYADYTLTGGAGMTQCSPPDDIFGYTGSCFTSPTTYPASETSIEALFYAVDRPFEDNQTSDAITFTCSCTTGSFGFSIDDVDDDGYFVVTINSECVIRFIGPVTQFRNAFNATFAGTGISCTVNDDDWFLGCKVREAYVGTAYQPSFPSATVSPTSFTLTGAGDEQDITVSDTVYEPIDGAAGFNGGTNVVTDAPYSGQICPPGCGGSFLPATTGFTATGSHSTMVSGYVRERYNVSLRPQTWSWSIATSTGDPCEPSSPVWTVT